MRLRFLQIPQRFSHFLSMSVLVPALLVPGVHASAPADNAGQDGAATSATSDSPPAGLALLLAPPPADQSAPAPAPQSASKPHMLRWVYMVGTQLPDSVRQHPEDIDVISPAWYHLDANGNVYGDGSAQVTTFAHDHGIKVMPLIDNDEFDADSAHDVLIDSQNQTRALDGLQWLVNNFGYDGINIDFENLYNADRNGFSAFMANVYARIHREVGKTVTMAIGSKTKETYDGFAGPFDYAALAPSFDYAVVMTYDEHYAGGEAGPVASLSWVEGVIKYATQSIPASKLLLGLPFYGYNWNVTAGGAAQPMSYNAIVKTVFAFGSNIQMDAASQTPVYTYQAWDGTHQIWFENSTSLGMKLQLAAKYGLAGWGAWRGGMEDQNFWNLNLSPTAAQG